MKCIKCNIEKNESQFSWKHQNIQRSTTCKVCHSIYRRQHYLSNHTKYIIKAAKNNKIYKVRNKNKIIEYLKNHSCVDCGEKDPVVLDFDHCNKETKNNNVSTLVHNSNSWKTILEEIAKCEVRCANCHRRRHARQKSYLAC